jgi:hypothetical protein
VSACNSVVTGAALSPSVDVAPLMEVSLAGTIDEDKLRRVLDILNALAGHEPSPIVINEMVLRYQPKQGCAAPISLKSEIRLRRYSDDDGASIPSTKLIKSRWVAYQYGRPPWGDLAMAKLPATVRTVTESCCSGPDVLGFWKGLGYVVRREMTKAGYTCDVVLGPGTAQKRRANADQKIVHFLVSRLSENDGSLSNGEQHFRQFPMLLVEAWVRIDVDERYEDAIQSLVDVCHVLSQYCPGVCLSPLPIGKHTTRQA